MEHTLLRTVTGLSISCSIIFGSNIFNTQSANYKKQKMFSLILSNEKCKIPQPINSVLYI